MTNHTREFLNIIRSSVTGIATDTSGSFLSDESFFQLVTKHRISTMFYYGLQNSGVLTDEIKARLYETVLAETMISEQQLLMFAEITNSFDKNGIDYLPLKGCILKSLYPKPEIRRMGDIDILVRKDGQYCKTTRIMEELGFKMRGESDHELSWERNGLLVELHSRIIPSYNKDFYAFIGDGWELARLKRGTEYEMSPENMFVYLFTHFTKHYRDSGIGIIHMCDLYLYMESTKLDYRDIDGKLKKLKLYDFYCNVRATLEVWFEGKEPTELTDHITSVIFNSGVYGTCESNVLSSAIKAKKRDDKSLFGKLKKIIKMIFPPYSGMKNRHLILFKFPVLLPVFWVVRWFDLCFGRRDRVAEKFAARAFATEENVKAYEKSLKYVGLEYNFK